VRLTCVQ